VQRQNVAAWYVCENQSLWINLGAYLYGTPAGCADQTVSFHRIFLIPFELLFEDDGARMALGCLLTTWYRSILMVTPLRMSEGEVEACCGVLQFDNRIFWTQMKLTRAGVGVQRIERLSQRMFVCQAFK
jgi:hypothetical protein